MRKTLGGIILAVPVAGIVIGASAAGGAWWIGPLILAIAAGLFALIWLGVWLVMG